MRPGFGYPSACTNAILVAYTGNELMNLPALFGESASVVYYAPGKA